MYKVIMVILLSLSSLSHASKVNSKFVISVQKITSSAGSENIVKCYTDYELSSDQEVIGEGSLKLDLEELSMTWKIHQSDGLGLWVVQLINEKKVASVLVSSEADFYVGPFGSSYILSVRQPVTLPEGISICK